MNSPCPRTLRALNKGDLQRRLRLEKSSSRKRLCSKVLHFCWSLGARYQLDSGGITFVLLSSSSCSSWSRSFLGTQAQEANKKPSTYIQEVWWVTGKARGFWCGSLRLETTMPLGLEIRVHFKIWAKRNFDPLNMVENTTLVASLEFQDGERGGCWAAKVSRNFESESHLAIDWGSTWICHVNASGQQSPCELSQHRKSLGVLYYCSSYRAPPSGKSTQRPSWA